MSDGRDAADYARDFKAKYGHEPPYQAAESSAAEPASAKATTVEAAAKATTMSAPKPASASHGFLVRKHQSAGKQRNKVVPPPATMPSSTAARVACIASSTRAFFSFNSVSVAAPTLMTATPPTSLARRS